MPDPNTPAVPAPQSELPVCRLLIKTHRADWRPADLAQRLQDSSGQPVKQVTAASPQWWGVQLQMPRAPQPSPPSQASQPSIGPADACQQTAQRLRADPELLEVLPDRPVQPPRPFASSAR